MALADYAHWNEDAHMMWWLEEGQHPYEPECDDYDSPDAGWDYEVDDDYEDDDLEGDAGDYVGPEDLGWDGGLEA